MDSSVPAAATHRAARLWWLLLLLALVVGAAGVLHYAGEWPRDRTLDRLVAGVTAHGSESLIIGLRRIQAEATPEMATAVLDDPRTVRAVALYVAGATGATFQARLADLAGFPPDWQREVLAHPRARATIMDYYGARVREAFDPEAGRYDFRSADRALRRLALAYPDSPEVSAHAASLAQRRSTAISHLTRAYEAALSAPRLEPDRYREDVAGAFPRLRQLEPGHPLLTDPRAARRLAAAVQQSLGVDDHARAAALLDAAGESLREPEFDRLRATLETAKARQEDERRAEEALSRLARSRNRLHTLDGLLAARSDMNLLAELGPHDPVFLDVQWQLEQALSTELARHIEGRRWPEAEALLLEFAGLMTLEFLTEQRARLSQAELVAGAPRPTTHARQIRLREQVQVVNTLLRKPVLTTDWETRFGHAFRELVALSDVHDRRIATVRRSLALLYRDRARETLATGGAADALALVEKGRAFMPESRELEALEREIASLPPVAPRAGGK